MASFTYVDTPNSNLICCICRMPFIDPVSTSCNHTFCSACIHDSLSHSSLCPIDRSPLDPSSLSPASPIVCSLVDELIVECPHRSEGCMHTCERATLSSHLKDSCEYCLVSCPSCETSFLRRDQSKHKCYSQQSAPCEQCGQVVLDSEVESHARRCFDSDKSCSFCSEQFDTWDDILQHKAECPLVIVTCPQAGTGCPWKGTRSNLDIHLGLCPYEAIKGFFAIQESKMSPIKEENIILRSRVNVLERRTHTMEQELKLVKTVLGPWYRTDIAPPLATRPRATESLASTSSLEQYTTQEEDTLRTNLHRISFDEMAYNPGRIPSLQHRASSSIPHFPEPSGAPSAYVHSVPQNPVAPLNLSTTLEGSLGGLRDSVISLASSVDSLARRNDVALTNETRRLNEETMSMRAAIHGLRLQVHNIMMEMNAQVTGRTGPVVEGQEGSWPPSRFFFPPLPTGPPGPPVTKL